MDSWLKTRNLLEEKGSWKIIKILRIKLKKNLTILFYQKISKTANNVTLTSPSSSKSNIESKK
jgi:hypothetical protein